MKIGTVSQLPGANMLLVTAQPRELITASSIIKIVDAKRPYVIKALGPAASIAEYASNTQIEARLGDIAVGTFSDPPLAPDKAGAIIDIHNDELVAIAPADELDRIAAAAERLQGRTSTEAVLPVEPATSTEPNRPPGDTNQPLYEANLPAEPNRQDSAELQAEEGEIAALTESGVDDANASELNDLFGRLLSTLDEAEKEAKQMREAEAPPIDTNQISEGGPTALEEIKTEPGQPNEPNLITTVPDTTAPKIVPAVEQPKVPIEPSAAIEEFGGQPKPADLSEILRRLEALEAGAVKAAPAAEPAPAAEAAPAAEPAPAAEAAPAAESEPAAEAAPPAEPEPVAEAPFEVAQPNDVKKPAVRVRYGPSEIPNGDQVLKVGLPEKMPLVDFLSLVGEYLGLDYLYKSDQVKGDVTFRLHGKLRGQIKVKDLYPLLESVMQFHGFAMTRKGNLVTIVPMAEVGTIDPRLVSAEAEGVDVGDVVVTRVFELQHIDTANAQKLLESMKLGVVILPIPEAGTLIVTGFAYRMSRIEEVLDIIDKPGEEKEFRYRQLKFTTAQTLAPKIKALVEQMGEISITVAQPTTQAAETPLPTDPRARARELARRRTQQRGRAPTAAPAAAAQPTQPSLYLDFDERTNRVLMIGLSSELDMVEQLIDTLDMEQQDLRSLRLYEIQNVDAEEVKNKLAELGIISAAQIATGPGARRAAARAARLTRTQQAAAKGAQAAAAAATTTAGPEEPLAEEPQVVILETINSLLVNATDEQHIRIATVIGYVDSEQEARDIPYLVYPLENQDPETLATVLNQLIQESVTREEKDAKIVTTQKRTEEDIIIIPDATTYSLIVYASKKNQQWISALITQLDEYRPQVLLDATLVEVTKNEEFTYDLDLVSKLPRFEPGESMDNLTALLQPFPAGRITEVSAYGGDKGKFFYADEHVQLLLEMMHKKNYGRVLARPKLFVKDNQEGIITTEEEVSVARETTDVIPGTASQTSTAVSSVTFESYISGITLTITPHISKGNQLQLAIKLTRIDFRLRPPYEITSGDTVKKGPTPPDLLSTDVDTVVTVPDGRTVILGGLEKVKQSKGGTKVPILGDIPLIGLLFRNIDNADTQTRLYVFVKAHILRPGEELSDLELVSAKNRATFERYEEEMQKYEDWPGIKPKPMDPIRILETD
jgi:type II secretory pathway component GspD/PulD (secretin)